jgi:glycosyltransferase involved in cell wall biosynthesis
MIPTFHSGKTLETCLQSILNQSYRNIELIVVDAFSKDDTRKVAEKFGVKIFSLAAERSPSRNFGAKQAVGRFVLFVDSDMELSSSVIEECVSMCILREMDAVIIPEESVGESFVAKCVRLEKAMRLSELYCEAPRFFTKTAFEFVGGYDENLVVGEDFELTQRIRSAGFTVGRSEAIIKHHEESTSLKNLVTKLYYYGKTLPLYARKEPSLTLKTSSPAHLVKNLPLLKQHPVYFTGLCSLKLVEYAAYLTGALVSVLSLIR